MSTVPDAAPTDGGPPAGVAPREPDTTTSVEEASVEGPSSDAVVTPEAAATEPPAAATEPPEAGEASSSLLRPLVKLFRGEYLSVTAVSAASFMGGLCEAFLLVLVANLALTIGGQGDQADLSGPMKMLGSVDTSTLFVVALLLTFIRLLFQYVAARMMARTITRMTRRLRIDAFDDYVHASWELQSSQSESAIQDLLLRHVSRAQAAVVSSNVLLSSAFMVLALLVSAFIIDPLAAALIIVVGGLLFVLLRPLTSLGKRLARHQMAGGLDYAQQSREAIDLSLEVRAFGVSDEISKRLDDATMVEIAPLYRSQLVNRMLSAVYSSAAVLILLFALLGLDTFLSRPLASIGAIVVVLIRALNQLSAMQNAYHNLSEFVPYIERLDAERARFRASVPPHGTEHVARIETVEFRGVGYSYDGTADALQAVTFEVGAGEAVGIIGPSGSGKSTLIQLLLRLRHPGSGEYLINGIDAGAIDDDSWFSRISFVPQDCRVFDDTVAENIRFFRPDVTMEQIESAARRAHIHREIMGMSDGYDTVLGSRGGALSGGQRQRIAIARALVTRPSMLVLDEPTSALDLQSESLVQATLEELKQSMTLFVIAHRLSTLNTCDRIMVMRDGELQAFGARSELEQSSDFYREALSLSKIRA